MSEPAPSPQLGLIKAWEAATARLNRARARYNELDDAVTAARTEMLDAKSAEESAWIALGKTRATGPNTVTMREVK